jgi:hypothetical protein
MKILKNKPALTLFALMYFITVANAIDLTDPSGIASITGSSYVNNMNVVWKINTGIGKRLNLTYDVRTENNYDYVRIYEVNDAGIRVGNPILVACGAKSGRITTSTPNGRAEIEFKTDGSVNGASGYWGFSVFYEIDNTVYAPGDLNVSQNAYVNGNVEVGTRNASATSNLLVNGTIKAWELTITESGWADYVFEDDYQLPPLKSVEQHIHTNGHLPEMPSASEVKSNGVNIAEIQVKLLQKIEELTLYVIKQQKEIEELKKLKKMQ